jgi:hypothetical protein
VVSRDNVSRLLSRKGRFDPQPSQVATVLLASSGGPFSNTAIEAAVRNSDGGPVAVLTIARVYGSSFGLPNPGLLPTGKELAAQEDLVRQAILSIEKQGLVGWGQVAATRRPGRTIARVARVRGVDRVVVCEPPVPRWRRVVEGDLVKEVRRRLGPSVHVTGVA